MKIPDLYLNVDTKHGLGHKMRTWAIAEEYLRRGGTVHWTWDKFPEDMCVTIFDGYFYTNHDRERWRDAGHLVVTLDDFERAGFSTHILINYNHGMNARLPCFSTPQIPGISILLLGTKYFPLRDDYKKLVSIDGEYPFDADAVERQLSASKFAEAIASCSYVLTSAGGTVYEVMYLCKPMLLRKANNTQAVTYNNLLSDDLAMRDNAHNREYLSRESARKYSSNKMRGLVDGNGASRIVEEIIHVVG